MSNKIIALYGIYSTVSYMAHIVHHTPFVRKQYPRCVRSELNNWCLYGRKAALFGSSVQAHCGCKQYSVRCTLVYNIRLYVCIDIYRIGDWIRVRIERSAMAHTHGWRKLWMWVCVCFVDSFWAKNDENVENARESKVKSERVRMRVRVRESGKIFYRGDATANIFIFDFQGYCSECMYCETFSWEHRQNNKINIFLKTCMNGKKE